MSSQAISVSDVESYDRVMFSRDGALLHPQPTKDALDPLNWKSLKKHSVLGILIWMYFMFTYITTTSVTSFPEIQRLYNITYSQVNLTVAMPSLGLALGPLVWSSLSDIYGRRIIFIIGTTIALLASIGTIFSKTYSNYMVARAFQGFGVSPGGTVGMAIINDMFFDYERGQKVGLWVLAINTGLLAGPIIGGLVGLAGQIWVNTVTAILFGVLLILQLAFLPETLYPRSHMLAGEKIASGLRTGDTEKPELKRTTDLPFLNFRPVPGMRHPRPWDSLLRFGVTFKYPVVVLAVVVFCFSWYWWILSIITMVPAAYAQYSPSTQGLLFLGLLLGTWFSELFCSGRLSDWLVHRLEKQKSGVRLPETRLWVVYPAALLSAVGLMLWGISIDRQLHWMVGQVAFFLFAIGLQTGNTAISSYIVDCYPQQSMSIVTFYSVFLDLSAVINPFFIAAWISAWGYTKVFVTQGTVTFCITISVISIVHKYGSSMRAKSGEPSWVNAEYDVS